MIEQVFLKRSSFKRFGATVIYPIKTDWNGKEHLLSLEDVKRVAFSHARRRELSDSVEVVSLFFDSDLQVYVAVYGHIDKEVKG